MDSIRPFLGMFSSFAPKDTESTSLAAAKDPRVSIDTLVVSACTSGDLDALKQLIEKDPGIVNNSYRNKGNNLDSPLYIAARAGHYDVVEFLIHSSADITALNSEGKSPAMIAASCGHIDIVKLLVEYDVDIEQQAYDEGYTILSIAAAKGHIEIVRYLLSKGANINQADNKGRTPLFCAAYYSKSKSTVRELALKGGNLYDQLFYNPVKKMVLKTLDKQMMKEEMQQIINHIKSKEKID